MRKIEQKSNGERQQNNHLKRNLSIYFPSLRQKNFATHWKTVWQKLFSEFEVWKEQEMYPKHKTLIFMIFDVWLSDELKLVWTLLISAVWWSQDLLLHFHSWLRRHHYLPVNTRNEVLKFFFNGTNCWRFYQTDCSLCGHWSNNSRKWKSDILNFFNHVSYFVELTLLSLSSGFVFTEEKQ